MSNILNKWSSCIKEKLGKEDPMDYPTVKLRLRKDRDIKPLFCMRTFDTPFYLRTMYEQEIKNCLDAGQIVLCGTEPSRWASKEFLVLKGDGTAIRNVSDFKRSNQAIEKLNK